MSRIKSKKYDGVYLNRLKNGDISYSITYKNKEGNKARFTVGKKSHGITEILAYNKRSEFINDINLGIDPIAHKKKKNTITLDKLADVYFEDKRCMKCDNCKAYQELNKEEKATAKDMECTDRRVKHQYNKYKLHLKPKFGKEDIESIKKDDIQKFRQSLKAKDKSGNTINGIIQLMNAIINYSIKNKELKIINPCVGIAKLKTDSDRERYLTTDEVKRLLSHIKDDRALLFVRLSLSTGGRLQTILNIKKKDITLIHSNITLKDIKNGNTYRGFIDDELKELLRAHMKSLKADDYIIGGKATPLSVNALSVTIRPTLNELFNEGLETDDSKNRVVIHTLRHTFASHLAINGTPIFTIQKLMNHKDIKMTLRYAKLAPDSGLDMVKGLYK